MLSDPGAPADLNFQPQTRKNGTKVPRPARPTANDQNYMPMGRLGQGRVTGPRPKTAQGGFVLEGVRGDYSGSMSVFPCGIRFGRLAAMGPPAKTQQRDQQ